MKKESFCLGVFQKLQVHKRLQPSSENRGENFLNLWIFVVNCGNPQVIKVKRMH